MKSNLLIENFNKTCRYYPTLLFYEMIMQVGALCPVLRLKPTMPDTKKIIEYQATSAGIHLVIWKSGPGLAGAIRKSFPLWTEYVPS